MELWRDAGRWRDLYRMEENYVLERSGRSVYAGGVMTAVLLVTCYSTATISETSEEKSFWWERYDDGCEEVLTGIN